ncbi:unnamed protein product [Sphacelaria rigidula]
MDEIDSALDTHKVRRVAAMLAARTSDGNEQCIVISHRPEMHERASHLLGIYHCKGTARTVGLALNRASSQQNCDGQDDRAMGDDERGSSMVICPPVVEPGEGEHDQPDRLLP